MTDPQEARRGATAKRKGSDTTDSTRRVTSQLLDEQVRVVTEFRTWLDQHGSERRELKDFTAGLQDSLSSYQSYIQQVQKSWKWSRSELSSWAQVRHTRTVMKDSSSLIITGPATDSHVQIQVQDEKEVAWITGVSAASMDGFAFWAANTYQIVLQEKSLGYVDKMCRGLKIADSDLGSLFKMMEESEKERSSLSQPASETVRDHISLLGKYNDIKDIGQQLIGLIAENRGIPTGSLYEFADYGVTSKD